MDMLKTMTWIRHGQSDVNVIRAEHATLTKGQIEQFRNRNTGNHRLTQKGRMQARQIGELIRSLGFAFDMVVSATYIRAIETLIESQVWNGSVELSPLLDERSNGVQDYLLHDELLAAYPKTGSDRDQHVARWRPPNGENMRDVLIRVLLFTQIMLPKLEGGNGNVLLFAHSRVISTYMWWALQLGDDEIPGSTTSGKLTEKLRNGEMVQFGWAADTLRPTHYRRFRADQQPDMQWKLIERNVTGYSLADLRHLVDAFEPIMD